MNCCPLPFVLLLCVAQLASADIEAINTWYEFQNATLLGDDYRFALASLEFAEDLYIFDGAACPLLPKGDLETGLSWPPSSCTCSHLNGSHCGVAVEIASSQFYPEGLPVTEACQEYCARMAQNYSLCNTSSDIWQELQLNLSLMTDQKADRNFFRYLHTDPTAGFHLEVTPIGGSFYVFGSQTTQAPTRWDHSVASMIFLGRQKIIQCPMFDGEFGTGTWFFAIEAVVPNMYTEEFEGDNANLASVTITLIPGEQTSDSFPSPDGCDPRGHTVTSSNPDIDIQCMRDGEVVVKKEYTSNPYFYYMMVEQCTLHTVLIHSATGDRDVFISFEPPAGNDLSTLVNSPIGASEYGDDYVTFHPCIDGREPPFPIFIISNYNGPFYLLISSRFVNLSKKIVDWPVATGVMSGLLRTVQLECQDEDDSSEWQHFPCQSWRYGCDYSFPSYPFLNPVPAFPQSSSIISGRSSFLLQTLYLGNGTDDRWPVLSNVLSQVVFLSGPQILSISEDRLGRCVLVLPNGCVGNAQGEPASGRYPFLNYQPTSCNASSIMQLTDLAQELFSDLSQLNPDDERHIIELSFALDTVASSPLWSACVSALSADVNYTEGVVGVVELEQCNTTDPDAFSRDPCCSLMGQQYDVCPTVEAQLSLRIPEAIDEQAFADSMCSNCSYYSMEQLMLVQSSSCALEINAVNGDTSNDRIATLKIVDACLAETMGRVVADGIECSVALDPLCETANPSRYLGAACTTDEECGLPGSVCDRVRLQCLIPTLVQEQQLIQCIVANMNASAVAYTEQLLAASTNDAFVLPPMTVQSTLEQLLWNRTRMFSCVGRYEQPIHRRHHWTFDLVAKDRCYTAFERCNNLLRVDKERSKKGESCRDFCGNGGAVSFHSATEESCLSWSTCNWDTNITDKTACLEIAGFCGLCADDGPESDCLLVDGVEGQQQCEELGQVCLLPNGRIAPELTPEECQMYGECDGVCSRYQCLGAAGCGRLSIQDCSHCSTSMNDNLSELCPEAELFQKCTVSLLGECADEESCVSIGGRCSDATEVEINKDDPGYCRIPFTVDPNGWRPVFSCRAENNTLNQYFGCNNITAMNLATCENTPNATWHWQATTREECLALQVCVADVYQRTLILDHRGNYHSEEDCVQPNEEWRSAFEWTPGQWTRGRMVPVAWHLPFFGSRYQWASTIDFGQLNDDLLQGASLNAGSKLQASNVCQFNREPQLLGQLTCDCLEESTTFDGCRAEQRDPDGTTLIQTVGSIFKCLDQGDGSGNDFYSPPILIHLEDDAIRPEDVCIYLDVHRIASSSLMREFVPQVPLSFAARRSVQISEVVTNDNDIVVGTMIGDGAGFEVRSGGYPVNFTLCLLITIDNLADLYPVFDFATMRGDKKTLQPLVLDGVRVSTEQPTGAAARQFLCVDFRPGSSTNEFDPDLDYVPVRRLDAWRDISSEFSTTNLALIYTLAVIYLLLLPVGVAAIWRNHLTMIKAIESLWAVGGAMLVAAMRSAYFFMAGAGVFAQGRLVDLEFVFIIFPIFVVFAIFALQAFIWLLTLNHIRVRAVYRWMLPAFVCFFLTFAVWAGLFAGLSPKVSSSCGGLIQPTVDTSARDALNLAFSIYLVVLACLLLFLFTIAPFHLLRQVKQAGDISILSVVSQILARVGAPMVGLVILAVLILVLCLRLTSSEFFVFFLLIVSEVVPIVLMFYRLSRRASMITFSSNSAGSRPEAQASDSSSSPSAELQQF